MPPAIYILKKKVICTGKIFGEKLASEAPLLFFFKKKINDPGAKMHSQVHHKSEGTKENSVNFLAINCSMTTQQVGESSFLIIIHKFQKKCLDVM